MCSTLMSTKCYSPGDVIASSLPFVHVLCNQYKRMYCDYCMREDMPILEKCSKCNFMYYCNSKCKANDWNAHQLECDIFVMHINDIMEITGKMFEYFLMLLRISLMIQNNPKICSQNYDLPDGHQRCLNDLETHEIELKSDTNFLSVIDKFSSLFKLLGIEISFDQICHLMGQINTNGFSLYGVDHKCTQLILIGCALYIPISVFNHSCMPNADFVNYGTLMQIRAMSRIAVNDEIIISYIDFEKTKSERQLELKRKFCFDCHCVKCESNCDFDYHQFSVKMNNYSNKINSDNRFCRTESKHLIELGNELISLRRQLCPSYWPTISYFMYSFAQFYANINDVSVESKIEIESLIELTEQNLKITHGINHIIYKRFITLTQNRNSVL